MNVVKKWDEHQGEVIDEKNGFTVIECVKCGFCHVVPIPLEEVVSHIYNKEYYTKEKPLYFKRTKEDIDWWNLIYEDRYISFENMLPCNNKRRILDVGSGPGFFLLHGKERGWQTIGVEPSPQAVEYSRGLGLEVVQDFLSKENAKDFGKFDVVHLNNVLEHIAEPIELLKVIAGLLNDGGIICIGVPNDYNPFQEVARNYLDFEPWWLAPPHHINYFNFTSLVSLLEKTGFSIELKESGFPIDIFLLMGDNYIGNDGLGRICHGRRKAFELNMFNSGFNDKRRAMLRKFAEMGIGREAIVYGRLR